MSKRERFQRIIICILLIGLLMSQSSFDISAAVKCKSVALNISKATIGVGDILPLTAITKPLNATGTQKWSSSNKKVATVNKYGAVTGIGEGTTKITVKIGKKKASCIVTVIKASVGTDIKQELVYYPMKSEVYTKEEVDKIVSEKVKEATKNLDLSNYASKKDIYTKSEVDKLIEDKIKEVESSSRGKTEEPDWEDGTELKCDNIEKLPLRSEFNTLADSFWNLKQDGYVQIDSVNIRKYHNTKIEAGKSRFLYKITLKGKLRYPIITQDLGGEPTDNTIDRAVFAFSLYNSQGMGTYMSDVDFYNNTYIKIDENEEFEAVFDVQGNYYDCNAFEIRQLFWDF